MDSAREQFFFHLSNVALLLRDKGAERAFLSEELKRMTKAILALEPGEILTERWDNFFRTHTLTETNLLENAMFEYRRCAEEEHSLEDVENLFLMGIDSCLWNVFDTEDEDPYAMVEELLDLSIDSEGDEEVVEETLCRFNSF